MLDDSSDNLVHFKRTGQSWLFLTRKCNVQRSSKIQMSGMVHFTDPYSYEYRCALCLSPDTQGGFRCHPNINNKSLP